MFEILFYCLIYHNYKKKYRTIYKNLNAQKIVSLVIKQIHSIQKTLEKKQSKKYQSINIFKIIFQATTMQKEEKRIDFISFILYNNKDYKSYKKL